MLVLTRRLNQSIIIAREVRVTVLKISPSRIELGVEAEADIPIDREEIHLRKQAAAMAAGGNAKERLSAAVPTVVRRKRVARARSTAIEQLDEQ